MKIISQTNFSVAKETQRLPSGQDKKLLESLRLDNNFRKYDFNDLAITGSEIVLTK